MPLPVQLRGIDDECTIIGDIDAWMREFERGAFEIRYWLLMRERMRELEEL